MEISNKARWPILGAKGWPAWRYLACSCIPACSLFVDSSDWTTLGIKLEWRPRAVPVNRLHKNMASWILITPFITVQHTLAQTWCHHSPTPKISCAVPHGGTRHPCNQCTQTPVTTMQPQAHGPCFWTVKTWSTEMTERIQRWRKWKLQCCLRRCHKSTFLCQNNGKCLISSPPRMIVRHRRRLPKNFQPLWWNLLIPFLNLPKEPEHCSSLHQC